MTDDWSSRSPPDLLSFIPYTWNFKLIVKVEIYSAIYHTLGTSSSQSWQRYTQLNTMHLELQAHSQGRDILLSYIPCTWNFKLIVKVKIYSASYHTLGTSSSQSRQRYTHLLVYTIHLELQAHSQGKDILSYWFIPYTWNFKLIAKLEVYSAIYHTLGTSISQSR